MTRILVADKDASTRRLLESMLIKWGYEGVGVKDGREAWRILRQDSSPPLAILDSMIPGIDGLTLCRKIREIPGKLPPYLILLTAKGAKERIAEGLRKGANDCVTKPFDADELHARVEVGIRMVQLQKTWFERIKQLEGALGRARQLRGLLRVCSYCKKICADEEQWQLMELYIAEHSEAEFTHGICPECNEKIIKLQLSELAHPKENVAQTEGDRVLKTQEALDYLRISMPTYGKYIRRGLIKATKTRHGWRVMKSELDRFLKGREERRKSVSQGQRITPC